MIPACRYRPGRSVNDGSMLTLFHHPFCPHSRFVRLALGEYGLECRLVEERVWERREEFLVLNPAGTTPVLVEEGAPAGSGRRRSSPNISTRRAARSCGERRLLPRRSDRARRGAPAAVLVQRQVLRRGQRAAGDGALLQAPHDAWNRAAARPTPTRSVRRATNIRYHLAYIGWLVRHARLARRRATELRRSRRGRASVGRPTIWATCHGAKTRRRRPGTRG